MVLPPELIDRVLQSLRDDRQSLLATSLVSRGWASWSQAYLFESIHLTPRNLQRWLENVSPDVNGPASHTRTLTLEEGHHRPWINPLNLDFPPSNLASFSGVRSLTLFLWDATLFNGASPEPYFGHFGKSLRTLSLQSCALGPGILFGLLSLLPDLQDLEITYLFPYSDEPDTTPDVPEITPSFRGTLSLADLDSEDPVLRAIVALPLCFTTINIRSCTFYNPDAYQTLLTSCRDTLVTLRFWGDPRGVSGILAKFTQSSLPCISRSARSGHLVSLLQQTRERPRSPSQQQQTHAIPYKPLIVDNLPKTSKDIHLFHQLYQWGVSSLW